MKLDNAQKLAIYNHFHLNCHADSIACIVIGQIEGGYFPSASVKSWMTEKQIQEVKDLITPPAGYDVVLDRNFLNFKPGDHIRYESTSALGGMTHYWVKVN